MMWVGSKVHKTRKNPHCFPFQQKAKASQDKTRGIDIALMTLMSLRIHNPHNKHPSAPECTYANTDNTTRRHDLVVLFGGSKEGRGPRHRQCKASRARPYPGRKSVCASTGMADRCAGRIQTSPRLAPFGRN